MRPLVVLFDVAANWICCVWFTGASMCLTLGFDINKNSLGPALLARTVIISLEPQQRATAKPNRLHMWPIRTGPTQCLRTTSSFSCYAHSSESEAMTVSVNSN